MLIDFWLRRKQQQQKTNKTKNNQRHTQKAPHIPKIKHAAWRLLHLIGRRTPIYGRYNGATSSSRWCCLWVHSVLGRMAAIQPRSSRKTVSVKCGAGRGCLIAFGKIWTCYWYMYEYICMSRDIYIYTFRKKITINSLAISRWIFILFIRLFN